MARPKAKDEKELMVTVGASVRASVSEELREMAESHHLSLAWIAGHLLMRGLESFRKDGSFFDQAEPASDEGIRSFTRPPKAEREMLDEVLEGLPKKADSGSEPWVVRIALRLEITGAAKKVGRVRAAIERYYLQRYAMRKLKDGGYEIALPYKDKADVKRRINLLLEEIEKEASRDNCVVETEMQMSDEG